jgi:23S rRNA (uracil1939-C5)-methyltransferase
MEFTVERLGHLGDAIARDAAGALVYAALALPGERIAGLVVDGRIAEPKILVPSPDRVRAPCPHFRSCGGCAVQHAADPFVASWKAEVVQRALAGQGLAGPMLPIATSPPASRRRAVLAGRRTKKAALVGFHARASDTIVAVPGCHLLRPRLMALWPALEALTALAAARGAEVALAVTDSETGPEIALERAKPLDPAALPGLAALARQHGLSRLVWNGEVAVARAAPVHRFGRARVAPPPGAFVQATAEGEAALLAAVRRAVGPARRIADLFAGCGTFALPLAEAAEVHAVEGDAAMLAALDQGWRGAEGLKRITTEARDLFRRPLLAAELAGLDAVVIDPPRAGAEAQTAEIARAGVPVVAAVSCNPASFARDARLLVDAGYRIDWVQPVDQFRWSAHVELAARLSRP